MRDAWQVIFKSLDPVFKEKLYFPVLLFNFSEEEMAKKEQVDPVCGMHRSCLVVVVSHDMCVSFSDNENHMLRLRRRRDL